MAPFDTVREVRIALTVDGKRLVHRVEAAEMSRALKVIARDRNASLQIRSLHSCKRTASNCVLPSLPGMDTRQKTQQCHTSPSQERAPRIMMPILPKSTRNRQDSKERSGSSTIGLKEYLVLIQKSGPVEGQINHLKLTRCSMYGRGSFERLCQRVLIAA